MTTVALTLIGADGVERTLKNLPVAIINESTMRGVGSRYVRSTQRGIREQKKPDGSPYPQVTRFGRAGRRMLDTGRTINSIAFTVLGPGSLVVGTNLIQAPTQHFGDDRKPKGKKLFAIPLTRQIARAYIAGRSLREQYPDAFVFESKKGGLFLVRRKDHEVTRSFSSGSLKGSKKKDLQFLFKLVPHVKIEGTRFLDLSQQGVIDILDYVTVVARRYVEKTREGRA